MKRVLVLLSSYNGELHIAEQIESILAQELSHDIYISIRDDGSKDKTCDVIKEYVKKYPDRIEFQEGENTGYNASFFSLINSSGDYDYYAISDQDDIWLKDKLQVACDMLDSVNEDIPLLYASTSYLVHDDLIPYGITRKKDRELNMNNTIVQNICPGHTQVMNKKLVDIIKASKVDSQRVYVYDSWIQNVANLFGKIVFDNTPHTYYRQYDGNQLGSGAGKVGQLFASLKRDKTGDGLKYRKQIEYFAEMYSGELKVQGYFKEINKFINSKKFFSRVKYALSGKVYRQNPAETIALYLAIVVGKF